MMFTQPCKTIFFSTVTLGEDKNTPSNNDQAGLEEALRWKACPPVGSLGQAACKHCFNLCHQEKRPPKRTVLKASKVFVLAD